MQRAKQNAINLYREGIERGRPREAIAAYTGDRYTQQSTGVADGRAGFIAFFEPFLERNPVREFTVVRALQDGRYVFLQVHQSLNGGEVEWLTTDFFDTDPAGKIVEHWDVIAPVKAVNASGRTQIDGPADITDLDRTEENRALVTAYIERCLVGRDLAAIPEFLSAENFHEHSADGTDGRDAFMAFFGAADCPLRYQECFLAVAEGNFVATLNRATWHGEDLCLVDLYRVEGGKIVEHWDNAEPVPPKAEWANSGKF
ncbi:MAG: nuclear transport factor 2 family protein [Pseudomonadota bacterium]